MSTRPASAERPARGRRVGNPAEMGQALDTMRVVATLAVVFYHAGLAYLTQPMRLTLWHVYDPSNHTAIDLFVYFVNAFAMPLFFMAAGVSAPSGIESRGLRVFLTHRVKRLLRPMLVGAAGLLLLCYLIWGYGLMRRGVIDLDNVLAWRFPPPVRWHLYGLGHLWFLEYLFIVCVIWGVGWTAWRILGARLGREGLGGGLVDRALASPWRGLWLALPTAFIFLLDTDTIIRVDNRLVPNLLRLLHYTYFFLAGGWLARVAEPRKALGPLGPTYLAISGLIFVVMSPFLLHLAASPLQGPERIVMALLGAAFPWCFVLGCLGTLLGRVDGKGPTLRYLSESSFWIYLIHLPIVAVLHLGLFSWDVPGWCKLPLIGLVAVGLSLVTYEYCVRYSFLGELINGARKRKARWGWRGLGLELGAIAGVACILLCFVGVVAHYRILLFEANLFEAVPGGLYRCARVEPEDLESTIQRHRIQSVIAFGGMENRRWVNGQAAACARQGATFHHMGMRTDRLPSRETIAELQAVLETAPRPILVEGYRGIDQCGLTVATALLLDGQTLDVALEQFAQGFGQIGGAEGSYPGLVLLTYRDWLASRDLKHTPGLFKNWVREEYLVTSMPQVPDAIRLRYPQVATTLGGTSARR